jgi:hypothetical protein
MKNHYVLDVEADGPCPGLYNMISFGIVNVADPTLSFLGEVGPITCNGDPAARAVSGISYEEQLKYDEPTRVMMQAVDWLAKSSPGRVIFWSDNPAFDWQFWNYYCHLTMGANPAGFSARRIGDFDAGRRRQIFNTNAWKKRRKTPHTHNPVDDARGNAEALNWIISEL